MATEPLRELRIAVVSDLHVDTLDPKGRKRSLVTTASETKDPEECPLQTLAGLVESRPITADLLVCCGDIANQANPVALRDAWRQLQEIRELLGASDLIATSGNHDVDSRHAHNGYDARSVLQDLDPSFPIPTRDLSDHFWARNYCIYEPNAQTRVVVLNSAAYHGQEPSRVVQNDVTSLIPEYEHGRVAHGTLKRIKADLDLLQPATWNILVCHHHFYEADVDSSAIDSVMKGADALLSLLGNTAKYGSWLVLHGHRHYPRLSYRGDGPDQPTVFGAGSLGAPLGNRSSNQFYLLTLETASVDSVPNPGRFTSWTWFPGDKWIEIPVPNALPPSGGFGWKGSLGRLKQSLQGLAEARGPGAYAISDFEDDLPELTYLIPSGRRALLEALDALPTIRSDVHSEKIDVLSSEVAGGK